MSCHNSRPLRHDAIILAGGQGSRLGGVDKANVDLLGHPLISGALEAASAAESLVVVGHTNAALPRSAVVLQEDPPGSGPASAVATGLREIPQPAPWVLVLACDLPQAGQAAGRLLSAAHALEGSGVGIQGAHLTDTDGRAQWLLGIYRSRALLDAIATRETWANQSLRRLLSGLELLPVAPENSEWEDVDTWDAHARWQARLLDGTKPTPQDKPHD